MYVCFLQLPAQNYTEVCKIEYGKSFSEAC